MRDTSNELVDDGHAFSWNGDILFSFDVCGHCEAHALLVGLMKWQALTHRSGSGNGNTDYNTTNISKEISRDISPTIMAQLPAVKDLHYKEYANNPNFKNCPLTRS